MPEQYDLFVGIDWASESHEVCVLNAERRVIDRKTIEHSGVGVAQLADLLSKLSGKQPSRLAVAIETPRGAVVETLVERQFEVYSINPKQMDRFRDRHTVAGAKDDRKDAYVLADSLSTDRIFSIASNWMRRRLFGFVNSHESRRTFCRSRSVPVTSCANYCAATIRKC